MKHLLLVLVLFCALPSFAQEEDSLSYYSEGLFSLLIGDYAEAERQLTLAIENEEEVAQSYYMRAKARAGLRKTEGCLNDINISIDIDPTNELAYDLRGKIKIALDDYEGAREDFEKAHSLNPELEQFHFHMGRSYYYEENFVLAIRHLTEEISLNEGNGEAYLLRAACYLITERNDAACQDLFKAQELGVNNVQEKIQTYCSDQIGYEQSQNTSNWHACENKTVISQYNAPNITELDRSNLESVVRYFYASRMRGDDDWKKVLPPEDQWTDRLHYKIDKYAGWNFVEVRLVEKKEFDPGQWWVKIDMSIEVNGETDGGMDEVTVEFDGENWVITSVPT